MFHILVVREPYRNLLRFLWFKDSNTTREVVEYRMKFHEDGGDTKQALIC